MIIYTVETCSVLQARRFVASWHACAKSNKLAMTTDVSTHLDRDWDSDFATWRAVHEGDILHNIADRVYVHHPWLQHMRHTLLAELSEAKESCMVLPQVHQALQHGIQTHQHRYLLIIKFYVIPLCNQTSSAMYSDLWTASKN